MNILAIDLGKFNSFCCFFDTATPEYGSERAEKFQYLSDLASLRGFHSSHAKARSREGILQEVRILGKNWKTGHFTPTKLSHLKYNVRMFGSYAYIIVFVSHYSGAAQAAR